MDGHDCDCLEGVLAAIDKMPPDKAERAVVAIVDAIRSPGAIADTHLALKLVARELFDRASPFKD
jgi:hypothetical protein